MLLPLIRQFLEPDRDRTAAFAGVADHGPFLQEMLGKNRLAPLAARELRDVPLDPDFEGWLRTACQASFAETSRRCRAIRIVADALAGLRWLLLRGPVLGAALYGDVFLRPFGDLDVLVSDSDADEAVRRLDARGCVPPAAALSDAYYRRFHLHVQRYAPAGGRAPLVELHWRMDHPYTLFDPDIAGLLDRSIPVTVLGDEVRMPCAEDRVLLLSMHLLKHAVWLPVWLERGEAARLLESGDLIGLVDLALACRREESIRWDVLRSRAETWGVAGVVRTGMDAVEALWPGLMRDVPVASFPRARVSGWRRRWYRNEPTLVRLLGRWRSGGVFRSVRMLDAVEYAWPPRHDLLRRYGAAGPGIRVRHGAGALRLLAANAMALRREQRMRKRMK